MDRDVIVSSLEMKHFEVEFIFDEQERIKSANHCAEATDA